MVTSKSDWLRDTLSYLFQHKLETPLFDTSRPTTYSGISPGSYGSMSPSLNGMTATAGRPAFKIPGPMPARIGSVWQTAKPGYGQTGNTTDLRHPRGPASRSRESMGAMTTFAGADLTTSIISARHLETNGAGRSSEATKLVPP
jgi:hypothetical protein